MGWFTIINASRLLALSMFGVATFLLLTGDPMGGGVAGAIAFGCASYPYLTEFSAFGVSGRLERELQNAEGTLRDMQRFALALAKTTFHGMTWSNRIGIPSAAATREQINTLDQLLTSMRVDTREAQATKAPFFHMLASDMVSRMGEVINPLIQRYLQRALAEESQYKTGREISLDDNIAVRLRAQVEMWEGANFHVPFDETDRVMNITAEVRRFIEPLALSSDHKRILLSEAQSAQDALDECISAGTILPSAEKFVSHYTKKSPIERSHELFPDL